MKLFAWKPKGYGPTSFFVMAENEADARQAVEAYIRRHNPDEGYLNAKSWGPDNNYTLTVAEAGQVLTNDNE